MTGASIPTLYTDEGRARLPALLDDLSAQGWLLYDMGDHNPLAHRLLGLGKTTRRAFALFPARGEPRLLHHAVEASAWRDWPGRRESYRSHGELETRLPALLTGMERVAMEHSPGSAVPTVDRVPGGILELVRAAGVEVVSSGDLITAFHSLWSPEGRESHFEAARIVQATALGAFQEAARAIGRGRPMGERDLMEWIETALAEAGVTEQVACIVATGAGAADPHYDPPGRGAPLEEGSLVLLDLWGGLTGGGIPADQTWMAFLGAPEEVDPRQREVWEAVREARDGALAFLSRRAREERPVQGWEVDEEARVILRRRGLEKWFSHRLGHSIDASLHGSGPNLDHLETRDERVLLPGVGFSVEPGVYIPGEIGVRSEVNVLWTEDGPTVTTPDPQEELLFVPPR
jgi:Xaa-Pro dipeptidase